MRRGRRAGGFGVRHLRGEVVVVVVRPLSFAAFSSYLSL